MTTNLPVVDPLKEHAPVMVVPEEHDGIASEEDLLDIFRQLPNPDRQFIVLPGAADALVFEYNRHQLWYTVRLPGHAAPPRLAISPVSDGVIWPADVPVGSERTGGLNFNADTEHRPAPRSPGELEMSAAKPTVNTEIIPYIFYRDVPAALDWLARAFGFNEEMRHATPSGMHAQMTLDGQRIMMGQGSKEWGMLSPHEAKSAVRQAKLARSSR